MNNIEDQYEDLAEDRDALGRSAARALNKGNLELAQHFAQRFQMYDSLIVMKLTGPNMKELQS